MSEVRRSGPPPLARLGLAYALLGEGDQAATGFAAALAAPADDEVQRGQITAWAAAAGELEMPPLMPQP